MSSNMSMKLVFHKESKKVLYAEARKDVVDFLFYILTVPVATITRIFSNNKKDMGGCLFNLYKSFENLNSDYIQEDHKIKEDILYPKTSFSVQERLLLPGTRHADHEVRVILYGCPDCLRNYYVDDYYSDSTCHNCKCKLNNPEVKKVRLAKSVESGPGLVKDLVTYFVMDDLEIKPMSTVSSFSLLNKFNVKDVGDIQEIVVVLGKNEAFKIFEASIKGKGKEMLTSIYIDKLVKQEEEK
ncbi:uncharacterized protein LOC124935269 [Impatiens glandulifera]|uniref:uncharacterized protein LOC124935269 n=1 Tax=Impatiens glandulifera TaxID=253017 RepID=UPI001FB0CC79|nr:uncharacterized protein LOC124935269 [Impatiens glandulifera]